MSALTALLTEKGVDVPSLREKLDVLQSPPPGGPRAVPATGADKTLPGSVPRTPDQFRIDTEGAVSPAEARQNQAELEHMKERMTGLELQLAAQKALSQTTTPVDFAQVVTKQTELLERVLDKPKSHASTIKVEPRVQWPKLGDDGPGGKEVEEFYESLRNMRLGQ